ncbi:MAG: hypothetical protein H6745_11560 [Deltaproteobacteria bacterium]|nr:hypothetical protein [Deltaproteobacteria bacterium]
MAPDPVLPSEGARVTISGSGFGAAPDGDSGVSLGVAELAVEAWAPDAVSAAVPTSSSDTSGLSVRRCGVPSAPFDLRVIAQPAPGAATVPQPPGCSGREFVGAAVPDSDSDDVTVFVAARCDDAASGYLQRFQSDRGCPLGGNEVYPLGHSPGAVAVTQDTAYVALTDVAAVARVAIGSGGAAGDVALGDGARATAVAARGGLAFAIVDDGGGSSLVSLAGGEAVAVSGVDPGLGLVALAWDSRRLLVTARSGANGKLVGVPVDGGVVASWSLVGCAAPGALATAVDDRVVIACGAALPLSVSSTRRPGTSISSPSEPAPPRRLSPSTASATRSSPMTPPGTRSTSGDSARPARRSSPISPPPRPAWLSSSSAAVATAS